MLFKQAKDKINDKNNAYLYMLAKAKCSTLEDSYSDCSAVREFTITHYSNIVANSE